MNKAETELVVTPHRAKGRRAQSAHSPAGSPGRLEDRVYFDLRQMIIGRDLLPGERIIPDEIARGMAVSRTPVINALKRLSQDRLVQWVPHRGVFVRRYTKREMAEVFELREVVEGLAARRAALRIGQEETGYFRDLFLNLDTTQEPPQIARYLEADREFHGRLIELANFGLAADGIHFLAPAFFAMGLIRTIKTGIREHLEILDAFDHRDPEEAEALMRAHLHRSVEWLTQEADDEDRRHSAASVGAQARRSRR